MKVAMRFLVVIAVLMFGSACGRISHWFAGSSDPPPAATSVFVVSGTANQPATTAPIEPALTAAIADGRTVIGITAGGQPEVVVRLNVGAQLVKAANSRYRQSLVDKHAGDALRQLRNAVARTAEHAPFDAITLANRFLTGPNDELWVLDSLLSTAGAIRFQENDLLAAEPADLIPQLSSNIGKLRSNTVHLIGVGDIASPQEPLSSPERKNLIAIATGALTASGAKVDLIATPRTGPGPDGPPVTAVPTRRPVIDLPATGPAEVPLPAGEFFVPDSDTLLDPDAATRMLAPFVTWAKADPGGTLEINGLTARGQHPDPDRQRALGLARAERIKSLLVGGGVAPERVICRGLGSYSPWFISETDPATGLWSAQRQALNRKIIIRAIPTSR